MVRFLSTLIAFVIALAASNTFAQIDDSQDMPKNISEQEQNPSTDQDKKLPRRKSDSQVKKESTSLPKDWETMTEKDRQKYSIGVLEDRFLLTTSNFKVISLSSGVELCSFDVNIFNYSSRTIQKIFVNYHWGNDSTYVEFSDLKPLEGGKGQISLSGQVCKKVTGGADYSATTCRADGLTQEQCRMRLFGIK